MKTAKKKGHGVSFRAFREFRDRIPGYADLALDTFAGAKPDYETVGWDSALRDLRRQGLAAEIPSEPALRDVEDRTRRTLREVHGRNPRGAQWSADSVLARCCYLVCRLLKPDIVVETGVAYGVSSAFILMALEQNGRGVLHSVDLPPLRRGYAGSWGAAVPDALKARWMLHRGTSERVLPGLLEDLGTIDLFVHDSLHTRRNMRREFEAAWPHLRKGGILLADDVERNGAFGELRDKNPALWRVVRDRQDRPLHDRAVPVTTFGIAVR